MAKKIYLISFTSWTEGDSYLYNDVEVRTSKREARQRFNHWCKYAKEECKWGSAFDCTPQERRANGDEPYDITEKRDKNDYELSSEAYEGYTVQVTLREQEIEL